MKILYFFKEYHTPMYQWPRYHFYDELEHHNCHVILFNPLEFKTIEEANRKLLLDIKENSYDLFLTPHNEQTLFLETIKEIKRMGIPTLLICFDNLLIPFFHYKIAPFFDLVWLTSKDNKRLFDKRGITSIFLPYAANPYLKGRDESINAIGFIGTPYGSRSNTINALTDNSISVYCHCIKNKDSSNNGHRNITKNYNSIYYILESLKFKEGRKVLEGALINYFKPSAELNNSSFLHKVEVVPSSELYNTYSKYSLSLSSTSARNTGILRNPLHVVNLRSFEIPMAGGIQICQYSPELAEYFEDGKEIVFYHNTEDLIEKAKYYCNPKNDETRKKIRLAARRRAETDHTWFQRFSKVFDYLGLHY